MKSKILNIALFLLLAPMSAYAELYKCTDETGKTTYTDQKCDASKEPKRLSITDNSIDSTEVRTKIQRNQLLPRDDELEQSTQSPSTTAGRIGPSAEARACYDAVRNYEIEVSSIRKDLAAMGHKHEQAMEVCGRPIKMHETHERLAALATRKRERTTSPVQQPEVGNMYQRTGTGYISPRGEFCQAVNGGAMCPTGGYVRIYK